MPRHQNSVVRSIIEQVFCFNLRKTHQDFDFFSSSKSLYVSLIFPYFIRALPAHNKGKRPPWLLDTYSPNYRELDKSRRNIELDNFRLNENYYSRRNRELDKSRRDENYYSLRNRELDKSRRDENYYSLRNRELDRSRHDENYYSLRNRELANSRLNENNYSRRNRELSNSLLRRDLLFSFLFLWWFFGELAILVEFSDENYWTFDENYWILSENSVILVEISTRIAGFEERIQ